MRANLTLLLVAAVVSSTLACEQPVDPAETGSIGEVQLSTNMSSEVTVGLIGTTLGPNGELYQASGGTTVYTDTLVSNDDGQIVGVSERIERQSSLSAPSQEPYVGGSINAWAVLDEAGGEEFELVVQDAPANLEDSVHYVVLDTASLDLLLKADTTAHDQCSFNGWSTAGGAVTLQDAPTWTVNFSLLQDTLAFDVDVIQANFFCSDTGDGSNDGDPGGGGDGGGGGECEPWEILC